MVRRDLNWDFPYRSQKMPTLADNVVATSQPLASQAGLQMLARGGNAIDAALAAAITLTVVEPVMNGIGGDLYALVWHRGELHGLNSTGVSPAAWSEKKYVGHKTMPRFGWDSVTVPGQVAGWKALSDRFGSLPFADLFGSAIRYATHGFPLSPLIAAHWPMLSDWVKTQPGFAQAFLPKGRPPMAGERWAFPEQAQTLAAIAASGGQAFYQGGLAKRIVDWARKTGGDLTMEDLAGHRPLWVHPISRGYRGLRLHEIPPNGQGIAALMALGMAENFDLAGMGLDSPDYYHVLIEVMKASFADLHEHVSDPATMKVPVAHLLSDDYLRQRARTIDLKRAGVPLAGMPASAGTVYITTADSQGNMVSLIQSNYFGFGSGIVVPGTGIALHNRGSSFSLVPGHPNVVAPGKRPLHTIIPGFVTRDDQPLMAFGVMGGYMQAQGHLQIVSRLADFQQNPQAASDAPRFMVSPDDHSVLLEEHASAAVAQGLAQRGHRVNVQPTGFIKFGSGQFIYKLEDGYLAASDSRRDGQAVGI